LKRQIRIIIAGLVLIAACIGLFWIIKLGTGDRTSDGGKETTEWSEPSSENGEESGDVATPADVESEADDDVESETAVEAGADVERETNTALPSCRTRWKKSGDTEPVEEVKGPPKIIIASDLHVLAKGLTDGGAVFTKKMDDGKTTLYSGEIVEAFLDEVLVERPDALVLSGDLTFEGERLSHLELAGMLKKVQDAGIQVLAIPGNHDINNPRASAYFDADDMTDDTAGYRVEKSGGSDKATGKEMMDGEAEKKAGEPGMADRVIETGTGGAETEDSRLESSANQEQTGEASEKAPDESITAAEFAEIYGEYGYEQAVSRDENSLSYIYPLRDDVWMMMLDTNQYDPVNLVDGDIRPETYQWMIQELDKADEAGIMVVPIGHHNILSVSRLYTRECMIWSRASAIWLFGEHNLPLYLSGHLHVQRMKKYKTEPGVPKEAYGVHEIVTSSLGMTPHQYGILTWDDNYQLEYQARRVDVENWARRTGSQDENLLNFNQYSKDWYYHVVEKKILKNLHDYPEDIKQDMAHLYADVLYHYGAGETMNQKDVETTRGYRMWERLLPNDKKFGDIKMMLKDMKES